MQRKKTKKKTSHLTKKQRSNIVKQARKGKDFGKKGKGFQALVRKLKKEGYTEEQAKKIAGAQFWKQMSKKKKGGK